MWMKVIDVLLDEVKKRRESRTRLISGLKELLSALEVCHISYDKYRNHLGYRAIRTVPFEPTYSYLIKDSAYQNILPEYYMLAEQHTTAVNKLIKCVWDLRTVLPIFAPEVMQYLWEYTLSEIEVRIPQEKLEEFRQFFEVENLYSSERSLMVLELLSNQGSFVRKWKSDQTDLMSLDPVALDFLHYGKLSAWAWGDRWNRESELTEYGTAVKKLQEFIRDEFKPEDFA